MKAKVLLSWHWLVNFANNKKSGYFWLRAHFFYLDFSAKIVIKHLQPHLPCLDNSQFGNGIKRVFRSNKLVWTLYSLYP